MRRSRETTKKCESSANSEDPTSLQLELRHALHHQLWDKALVAIIRGADPEDQPRNEGDPALHWAVWNRRTDVVDALLRLGAKPDYISVGSSFHGYAPLHIAGAFGNADAIPLLLAAGAPVDARGKYGYTPLMLAADKGRFAAAEHLLGHGANPNAALRDGQTALHLAVSAGQVDVVKLLLKHGADPDIADNCGRRPLQLAEKGSWRFHTLSSIFLDKPSSKHSR